MAARRGNDVTVSNPYSDAMVSAAASSVAAEAALGVDGAALQLELDRLRQENDRLRNVKAKPVSRLSNILSWSESRAIWTMRMSNMCNGCVFMFGAVGSFLLPNADLVQSFTRVVLAMYMMCVGVGQGLARRGFSCGGAAWSSPLPSPPPPPLSNAAPPTPLPPARHTCQTFSQFAGGDDGVHGVRRGPHG
jgi:hypothetical protein